VGDWVHCTLDKGIQVVVLELRSFETEVRVEVLEHYSPAEVLQVVVRYIPLDTQKVG